MKRQNVDETKNRWDTNSDKKTTQSRKSLNWREYRNFKRILQTFKCFGYMWLRMCVYVYRKVYAMYHLHVASIQWKQRQKNKQPKRHTYTPSKITKIKKNDYKYV